MKRDMDLIRELLLKVEASVSARLSSTPEIEGRTETEVAEHLRLAFDAGLLEGAQLKLLSGPPQFGNIGLTWSGHEFLDKVRDPEIWENTKAGAAKVGTFSLSLLGELAIGYAKAKAQALGLPMM